jgi:hypothetical protein
VTYPHDAYNSYTGADAGPYRASLPPEQPRPPRPEEGAGTGADAGHRRGRSPASPVIAPGPLPAALTAVLAALLALTAPLGRPALTVGVIALQAVTAAGWYRLNGMWPARQGIALAFLAGVTADVALLAAGRAHAVTAVIGSLGIWVLLVLILQLRNRSSPDERLYALTAAVTATVLTVLAAGHLAVTGISAGPVTAGSLAVAVAVLVRALPLPAGLSPAVALLAAAGAGTGIGRLTGLGTSGAVLGLAAGGCALIGLRVASYDFPSRFVHMTAGVALPLTLAAPAVYLLGRTLG